MSRAEKDTIAMWRCEKYGVSMTSENAGLFCARRYAAANVGNGEPAFAFNHCKTCRRGAELFRDEKYKGSEKVSSPLRQAGNRVPGKSVV